MKHLRTAALLLSLTVISLACSAVKQPTASIKSMNLTDVTATGFTMAWPALGNYRVYRGFQVWDQFRLFLDETKPPFKS